MVRVSRFISFQNRMGYVKMCDVKQKYMRLFYVLKNCYTCSSTSQKYFFTYVKQ